MTRSVLSKVLLDLALEIDDVLALTEPPLMLLLNPLREVQKPSRRSTWIAF
ncbi:hypothetical protein [Paramicrobacterium agarici]|uniref:hypothetical protein n=1 Tax=Paramicrobacterium agarici TaxID=630514 RepID=UPI0014768F7A|nr:hypothetical protein [Microbacterium agarici]